MKYAEFTIDSNTIAFLNSNFGVESVLLNGELVSKRFSFQGHKHELNINSKKYILESSLKLFSNYELTITLKENGILLQELLVPVMKKQRVLWSVIGGITGVLLYKLLNFLVG